MSEVRILAQPRTEFGKGAARRVRRSNQVPAVLYGHGEAPRHFSLPGHDLMLAVKHDPNVLLTLQTPDGDQLALAKSIVRHPVKGFLQHVDLVAVRRGERIVVDVPVHLTGSAAPDTVVDQQALTLAVEAEATHLPDHLEVDIEGLTAGQDVLASAVGLPAGVRLTADENTVVVHGLAPALEIEPEQAAPAEEPAAEEATS